MAAPLLSHDRAALAAFCRRHHIRRLSLFGSAIRVDFRDDSDVDVLVEFERGHDPDYFTLHEMSDELSRFFGGRAVDLVTERALHSLIRDDVLATAQVQYAQG